MTLHDIIFENLGKNLGKKIIAVILSLALWFMANIEQDIEKKISLDISYANLPADLVIINQPPTSLNLTVRGPRSQLTNISINDIDFGLDLASVSPGISRFEIRTDQIKAPRGVQVIGLSPAEIKLDVDRLVEKKVPVKAIIGPPDTGYKIVGEPVVSTPVVTITGPNKVLYNLRSVMTDLVSTTGVKSKFTIEVPFKTPPLVEVKELETVRVTVDVQEKISVKEFKDLDIDFVNFNGIEYSAGAGLKAELSFEGPYSLIKDLNGDNIKVYVNGKEIKKGVEAQSLKVRVDYPSKDKIRLKIRKPKRVNVKVKL